MMRKALTRFALWLCRRLDVNPIAAARTMAGADAVERGARWEVFYTETGGLRDMLATIRQCYFQAAGAVGHRDDDKLYEYVVADRLARELEREVVQVIATGRAKAERIAAAARENNARILPPL